MSDFTIDIETTGFVDKISVDYTKIPYRFNDTYNIHYIVVEDQNTGKITAFYNGPKINLTGEDIEFFYTDEETGKKYDFSLRDYKAVKHKHYQLEEFPKWVSKQDIKSVTAHNGINFDFLVLKMWFNDNYTCTPDTFFGQECEIEDTQILSKLLDPDRWKGHSLDNLSSKFNQGKIDFRPGVPDHIKWGVPGPDMLAYCIVDVQINTRVRKKLRHEWEESGGDKTWAKAYKLEKAIAELVTRQKHRGFYFDKEAAERHVEELDKRIKEAEDTIAPILPERELNKGEKAFYTPNKTVFKKDGTLAAATIKWAEKLSGELVERDGEHLFIFEDKEHSLPLPEGVPIKTHGKMELKHMLLVKEWLVGMGWNPIEWNDKDMTVNTKKEKLDPEKYEEKVDRYLADYGDTPFFQHQLDYLQTNKRGVKRLLMTKDRDKPIRVITTPKFTIGQQKEICPNLALMEEQFPYAREVVNYLTYKHRRNTILGGGVDPEFWQDEPDDTFKGYLALYREEDGRIPTSADTLRTNTHRMGHIGVANVPKPSVLFGAELRGLFGVDEDYYQFGYDFAGLEARIQAHYCWDHERHPEKPYCKSLTMEKPHDSHTRLSKDLTKMLGQNVSRDIAKNIGYACLPVENTEVLTPDGYKKFHELSTGGSVLGFDGINLLNDELKIEDREIENKFFYKDAKIIILDYRGYEIECTEDHKWVVQNTNGSYNLVMAKDIPKQDGRLILWDDFKPSCDQIKIRDGGIADVFCLDTGGGFVIRQNGGNHITGNCAYGAYVPKLAKMLGVDIETAQKLFDGYWKASAPLKKLKDSLTERWKSDYNKKYIISIDGRRISTRSSHSILNSLFQSSGVIAAKLTAFYFDRLMLKKGLTKDLFLDYNKYSEMDVACEESEDLGESFVNQLILYHDEAQHELRKDLVKFKKFSSEEEALAFRKKQLTKNNRHCGEVITKEDDLNVKHYYVPYTVVGDLLQQAISMTNKKLKLNVNLETSYEIGKNWKECH